MRNGVRVLAGSKKQTNKYVTCLFRIAESERERERERDSTSVGNAE